VETFRSGLIKTTDTYKTPITDIDASLATFAVGSLITGVSQAHDGVKIYPEPQWKDDGDGFATISVTGYGRTRAATGFTVEPRLTPGLLEEITTNTEPGTFIETLVATREIQCTKTDFVCRYVLAYGEAFLFGAFSTLESQFIAYSKTGGQLEYSRLAKTVSQPETNYFGSFTEVTAVVVYKPTLRINTKE
jgi:hypothetical protein